MSVGALLKSKELSELGISFLDALGSVSLTCKLLNSKVAAVKHFAGLAALLLLDVIHVRVAK